MLLTHRALILSVMSYAAPIWYICATELSKLQRLQNQALKICTGNHSIASLQYVHSEAKILPVADHLNMLCEQFLLNALQPSHASHQTIPLPNSSRMASLKKTGRTLSFSFRPAISQYLTNGITNPATYQQSLNAIHTTAVRNAIGNLGDNPLLGAPPLPLMTPSAPFLDTGALPCRSCAPCIAFALIPTWRGFVLPPPALVVSAFSNVTYRRIFSHVMRSPPPLTYATFGTTLATWPTSFNPTHPSLTCQDLVLVLPLPIHHPSLRLDFSHLRVPPVVGR